MSELREYKRKRADLASRFHKEVMQRNLKPGTPQYKATLDFYNGKWMQFARKVIINGRRLKPKPDAFINFINLCT